jgi:hypothetical protein
MAGEQRGIEPDALRMRLDNIGDGLRGEPTGDPAAMAGHSNTVEFASES